MVKARRTSATEWILSSVTIACEVDGETVSVSRDAIEKSKLVNSLVEEGEPVASIQAPFERSSVDAWKAFAEGGDQETFLGCVAALKVADFLQDEETTSAAAASANTLLFPNRELNQQPSKSSQEDEEALLSLPQHIAYVLLQSNAYFRSGRLNCMLATLSASCHTLAVSSCISDSELELNGCLSEHEDAIASVAPALAPILRKLCMSDEDGAQSGKDGTFERFLSPMTYLDDLSLLSCEFPWVPDSLTALTSLKIHNDCYEVCNEYGEDVFFHCGHLSNVTALQKLSLHLVYITSFDDLAAWLKKLPGLTRFLFSYTDVEDDQATALAGGLASCSHLESLSMDFSSDGDAASGEAIECLLQCVAGLGQLTSLTLGNSVVQPDQTELASMLLSLPLLQYLDVEGIEGEDDEGDGTISDALRKALCGHSHLKRIEGIKFDPADEA